MVGYLRIDHVQVFHNYLLPFKYLLLININDLFYFTGIFLFCSENEAHSAKLMFMLGFPIPKTSESLYLLQ